MDPSKAHHYIPQFYLKGFADHTRSAQSGKALLWVYEKGKLPRLSTPQREAHENNFYTFEDDSGQKFSIETYLARLESAVAPVFRRADDLDYFFSDKEKSLMSYFIALSFLRGPTGRGFLDQVSGTGMKHMLLEKARDDACFGAWYGRANQRQGGPTGDEVREWILEGRYEITQRSPAFNLRMMLEVADHLAPILFGMKWQILYPEGEQCFLTSDNPVSTLAPTTRGTALFGMGFAMPGVEVYFPISGASCLRLSESAYEGTGTVNNHVVRQINRAPIVFARRFVYCTERSRRIAELVDKVGFKMAYGVNAFARSETGEYSQTG